jgi:hypothetical protein
MNGYKKITIYFFIVLLAFANVNFNWCSELAMLHQTSLETEKQWTKIDSPHTSPFLVVEQRSNLQISYSSLQKKSISIALSPWFCHRASLIKNEVGIPMDYLIIPGLETLTIIFPFHYFW